ncbi:hypothetical protein D5018_03680 [Parashewanella curva]|uniref:Uncharacterized protein n=2 Tax=Parashewanella curva TaxID=2338552 RepID=A0A3L8Q2H0_9GAMM|nr:hypothetical protein D5018_03680 [Parashewanella curva]
MSVPSPNNSLPDLNTAFAETSKDVIHESEGIVNSSGKYENKWHFVDPTRKAPNNIKSFDVRRVRGECFHVVDARSTYQKIVFFFKSLFATASSPTVVARTEDARLFEAKLNSRYAISLACNPPKVLDELQLGEQLPPVRITVYKTKTTISMNGQLIPIGELVEEVDSNNPKNRLTYHTREQTAFLAWVKQVKYKLNGSTLNRLTKCEAISKRRWNLQTVNGLIASASKRSDSIYPEEAVCLLELHKLIINDYKEGTKIRLKIVQEPRMKASILNDNFIQQLARNPRISPHLKTETTEQNKEAVLKAQLKWILSDKDRALSPNLIIYLKEAHSMYFRQNKLL